MGDGYGTEYQNGQDYHLQNIETGLLQTVQWDDLVAAATILPEFTQDGRDEIEYYLGYLPAHQITLPFEPFLRALIQQFKNGTLPLDEYNRLSEDHIKLIRNEECRHNSVEHYDATLYEQYELDYLPYGLVARQRIVDILGYEPELTTSLFAEMYLRRVMSADQVTMPPGLLTTLDFKLIGLIRYREILCTLGKDAADNWPVLRNDKFSQE